MIPATFNIVLFDGAFLKEAFLGGWTISCSVSYCQTHLALNAGINHDLVQLVGSQFPQLRAIQLISVWIAPTNDASIIWSSGLILDLSLFMAAAIIHRVHIHTIGSVNSGLSFARFGP